MKMPAATLKLFLRSAGAPPQVLQAIDLFYAQDFSEFGFQPMAADEPTFGRVGMAGERTGVWIQAKGTGSRVVFAILCEGMDDEFLERIKAIAPDGVGPAVDRRALLDVSV